MYNQILIDKYLQSKKPKIGEFWYDFSDIGFDNKEVVLGMVVMGDSFGVYIKLDHRYFRTARHALVYNGLFRAIGFDRFFENCHFDKVSYSTE